jgi:hypothetical protein
VAVAVAVAVDLQTVAAPAQQPHQDDCALGIYLDRQGMLYEWNRARYRDYDLSDREFWKLFGPRSVPECACPDRQQLVGTIVKLHKNGHRNGEFRLHWGQMSAPVYSQLRSRLSVYLFRTTGNVAVVDMDLDSLAVMAGRGSKSVLKNLASFEASSLRHGSSHGTSPSQGSSRRKSSSSS